MTYTAQMAVPRQRQCYTAGDMINITILRTAIAGGRTARLIWSVAACLGAAGRSVAPRKSAPRQCTLKSRSHATRPKRRQINDFSQTASRQRAECTEEYRGRHAAGRQRSAKNATTHGLTTVEALLDSEDSEAYARHMQSYRDNHMPGNEQEEFFVTQLGECSWRLRRVRKFETGILNADPTLAADETLNKVCKLNRYEAAIERSYYRAFRK